MEGERSMTRTLDVSLTRTRDARPLATVHGLPGEGADLTPAELRALAATLMKVADECEAQPMEGKRFRQQQRRYAVA
jgi:hypothetical protein